MNLQIKPILLGKHLPRVVNGNLVTIFFCLQQLKQQRDKLRQYQKRINLQLDKERLLAKQLLKDGKKE